MIPFLRYKEHEPTLQQLFGPDIQVTVEPITQADMYYTDGEASQSDCKVIIDTLTTVYVPQLQNATTVHTIILRYWLSMIK